MATRFGAASQGACPRAGWVVVSDGINVYKMLTNCGTWGCLGCRNRNQARFGIIVEYGCLMGQRSYFITNTLRTWGPESIRDADYVKKAFKELLRRLKSRESNRQIAWLQVPELTRKLQPHLHTIVSGIGKRKVRCVDFIPWSEEWVLRHCAVDCLTHEWSKHWLAITRHSFMCFATNVICNEGAGAYLGKYLSKQEDYRDSLVSLGFSRRWSCSRNWPRGRVGFRGTVEAKWIDVQRVPLSRASYGTVDNKKLEEIKEAPKGIGLFERVGTPSYLAFEKRLERRRIGKMLGGLNASFRTEDVTDQSSGEHR